MRSLTQISLVLISFVLLNSSILAQSGVITTYAGPGLPVNGELAITQPIDSPSSVAPDGAGGFYVASSFQNRVYRVTADGRINLVVGTGTYGFSGDGGPATAAQLSDPSGVAVDTAGNLFIADYGDFRIRKVTPGGIISTVAGNGTQGFSGDGGPAISAQLNFPSNVAVDTAGNLYIADYGNCRIRKVTPGGIISTVAGNGTAGFSGDDGPATSAQITNPYGVAVDSAGNLFIADTYGNHVRKVTPGGIISTVAGNGTAGYSGDGGPATAAQLSGSYGVAVDTADNLFILEQSNRIREVTPDGIISTVAGNGTQGFSGDGGPAIFAQLDFPTGVAVDVAGNLFIADSQNNRIREVTPSGVINTVAGNGTQGFSGDGGPATAAQISGPIGVAVDVAGNLYIADSQNNRIRRVTPSGVINTVAGNGTAAAARLNHPSGVTVDVAGNLFIADTRNNRIRKVTPAGVIYTVAGTGAHGFSGDGGPATAAQISGPNGVAADLAGNLYIADSGNFRIRKVTPAGIISTVAGNGTQGSSGDGGPAISAQIMNPYAVAVDASGNLYIADVGGIRKVNSGGVISTVAGFNGTQFGVAVDSAGNLFTAQGNSVIRKMTPAGVISTVAGNGTVGFSGDGGPATAAQLSDSSGVAVDTAGNLFIADYQNSRIRKVEGVAACSALNLSSGGAAMCQTTGSNTTTQVGYAKFAVDSGTIPYGTAVFSFKQNGVTVTEAGVPASPPTTSARIFIDYRSGVNAIPSRSDSGTIGINTGIAVVNYASSTANVTYTFRDLSGATLSVGHGTVAAGNHLACFIDQLKDKAAPDFNLPSNFQNTTQFGTLEIASDQPISVLALRGANNQRNEFLITTTPVADLTQSISYSPIYFPQFVDGGGYTTSLVLLNTSNRTEKGILQILDSNGNPLVVTQAGGTTGSSFNYTIPSGGAFHFQTDGSPSDIKSGWVRLTPYSYYPTPIGSGVFSYNPGSILISESGIPSVVSTTHARVYVDLSGDHNTGLAIANVTYDSAIVAINAFQNDGLTTAGFSNGAIPLVGSGYIAKFADQFISSLPAGFTGVLDISSTTPFAALTLRALVNEREDFLMTTFPIADENQAAPSPIVFPQIVDGGGYTTQFILISSGQSASTTLNYFDESSTPTFY